MLHRCLVTTLALLAGPALAQTLTAVKVEPANAKVGEAVAVTAELDVSAGLNCGLRLHFGDGTTADAKINQAKDASYRVEHRYAKAGTYTVKAEPKTMLPVAKCLGKNQEAQVVVVAAGAAAAAAATKPAAGAAPAPAAAAATTATIAAGPACPAGWTLDAKSVNKKSGAFTCKAKAGTAAPASKLECPGSLGYYENTKKGQLGCRP